ncbi:MAG: outer membrane lipoprotein-sorting protein [Candidatus Aminicenantales bacterium]
MRGWKLLKRKAVVSTRAGRKTGRGMGARAGVLASLWAGLMAVASAVFSLILAVLSGLAVAEPSSYGRFSVSQKESLSGEWILNRVDENIISANKIITARMIIHGRRARRSIEAKSWIQGEDKAFTEYLAPARERGTKMLKLGDQLWTYSPATDRTILISGHMLRQSVMGSDLSYEDMMEDRRLLKMYEATVISEESVLDVPCWVLELKARTPNIAYPMRKIWVDKARFVILREERYARSGMLLKTTEVKSVVKVQGRWIPERLIYKDALKAGEGTEFIIDAIELDAAVPDYVFTKASLRK